IITESFRRQPKREDCGARLPIVTGLAFVSSGNEMSDFVSTHGPPSLPLLPLCRCMNDRDARERRETARTMLPPAIVGRGHPARVWGNLDNGRASHPRNPRRAGTIVGRPRPGSYAVTER